MSVRLIPRILWNRLLAAKNALIKGQITGPATGGPIQPATDAYGDLITRPGVYAPTEGTGVWMLTGDQVGGTLGTGTNNGLGTGPVGLDTRAFLWGFDPIDGNSYTLKVEADTTSQATAFSGQGALVVHSVPYVIDGNNRYPMPGQFGNTNSGGMAFDFVMPVFSSITMVCSGSSSAADALRTGNIPATAITNVTGPTAVYTAAAGNHWRLMRYTMELTDNASLAAAGELTASLQDAAGTIIASHTWAVPAAAGAGAGNQPVIPLDLQNGYLSAGVATALNLVLSGALATGHVRVNAWLCASATG
ncbi:MAG: hypothetical protein ACYCUI_11610 [Vulcanimicrobiaceae bacterium]